MEEINININDIFGEKKQMYNRERVAYCLDEDCYSLHILKTPQNEDYCGKCGNTKVGYASIDAWAELARERFGDNYVIKNKYGRN